MLRRRATEIAWIALVVHLILGVVPFAGSGLVLDDGWRWAMWALWVAGLAVTVLLLRRRSPWAPAVPLGCLLVWLVVVSAVGSA